MPLLSLNEVVVAAELPQHVSHGYGATVGFVEKMGRLRPSGKPQAEQGRPVPPVRARSVPLPARNTRLLGEIPVPLAHRPCGQPVGSLGTTAQVRWHPAEFRQASSSM